MGVLGALIAETRRGQPDRQSIAYIYGLEQTMGSGRTARRETGTGWKAAAEQTAHGMAHGAAKVWVGIDTFGASAAPPQAHADSGDGTTTEGDTLVRRTQRFSSPAGGTTPVMALTVCRHQLWNMPPIPPVGCSAC